MVVPNFVRQALTEQDMTVFGSGEQRRCFTHVTDVVQALIALAEHAEAVGQVYNVGSDQEVTVAELAWRVKQLTGSASRIVFIPYDQVYEEGFEDILRRVPDVSKLRDLIGYAPQRRLDEILTHVIAHEEARLGHAARL